jgi:hypothetical protein
MKKQILLLCFLLAAAAGFSQISKADASGFVTRNLPSATAVNVFNTVGTQSDRVFRTDVSYNKSDIVSLNGQESGLLMVVKTDGGNKEKFYPYASILYLTMSSDNGFNIVLRD